MWMPCHNHIRLHSRCRGRFCRCIEPTMPSPNELFTDARGMGRRAPDAGGRRQRSWVWVAVCRPHRMGAHAPAFPGKSVLNALVHLPLVLPPVVTGWLLLVLFGIRGPLG